MPPRSCECGCGQELKDDVVQFCVEEAIYERLERADLEARLEGMRVEDVLNGPTPAASDPHLDRARRFAAGEEV